MLQDSQSPEPSVAIFDFDNTLLPSDSFTDFFLWLLRSEPWRGGVVLLAVVPAWVADRITPRRHIFIRWLVWAGTLGISLPALDRRVLAYAERFKNLPHTTLRKDGLRCIDVHRRQGQRLVVATGSYEPLARVICQLNNLADVEVIGSSFQTKWGGLLALEHCYGAHKVTMLKARGVTPPWTHAYSDHASDLPLLMQATAAHLVNPSGNAVVQVAAALATPPVVLRWAT